MSAISWPDVVNTLVTCAFTLGVIYLMNRNWDKDK